jgi:hypothetical protein
MGILTHNDDAAPKRSLHSRTMLNLPRRTVDTKRTAAIEPLDPRRRGDQMSLLGACRLRTINQAARPNALAAGRNVIEKSKPLGVAAAPRADKLHPEPTGREPTCPHTDPVFDPIVTEPDQRRLIAAGDFAAGNKRRNFDHRQIIDREPHKAEKLKLLVEAV